MNWTRSHFEFLAAVIKETAEEHCSVAEHAALVTLRGKLAGRFAATNPSFKIAKFVNACKPSWEG